jgi:hypothetical protein
MREAQNAQFWCMLSMVLRPLRGMSMPANGASHAGWRSAPPLSASVKLLPKLVLCGGLRG